MSSKFPVWYNTEKYLSIYLFYTDYFNRFSTKTYNWGIYQTKVVMGIMSFTGKETVMEEKSV